MAKIRFTKSELKKQRDALRQYQRYLPTLQLKKQQLQMEILRQLAKLDQKRQAARLKQEALSAWAGLLAEEPPGLRQWSEPREVVSQAKNIAGVAVAEFVRAEFVPAAYDLFTAPMWLDGAVLALRELAALRAELDILDKALSVLRQQLRITMSRSFAFAAISAATSIFRLNGGS